MRNFCNWFLFIISSGNLEAKMIDLWIGLIVHWYILWPKNLILVLNRVILEAETTRPFFLITLINVLICLKCCFIEEECIRTSSMYTMVKFEYS